MAIPESTFPPNKPYKAIYDALLADPYLQSVVDDRITHYAPQKQIFPLIFGHLVGDTLRDISDDRKVISFDDDFRVRFMAPSTWSRDEMEVVSKKIEEIINTFFQEKIGDITVFNISPSNNGIFFDSDGSHNYKSLEYAYDIVYG